MTALICALLFFAILAGALAISDLVWDVAVHYCPALQRVEDWVTGADLEEEL